MPEDSESKENKSALYFADHSINDNKEENAKFLGHQITQLVSEIVEIISIQLPVNSLKDDLSKPQEILTDCINNDVQKSESLKNAACENDMPVRRSNRIRQLVIKKDESVISRSAKKSNKNIKKSESNIKGTQNESEAFPVEGYKINEIQNKYSHGTTKNKLDSKSSKIEKANKKVQNTHQSAQAEKKKQNRKRKTTCKSQETSHVSLDSNFEKDENNKNILSEPQTLVSTCTKVLDCITNSEYNDETHNSGLKVSDDQNCENNDKLGESCNLKPVKVKSRWWRSSELENVLNSDCGTSDNSISVSAPKNEVLESQPLDPEREVVFPVKETLTSESIYVEDSKENLTEVPQDLMPPQYEHIEDNIYRFNRKKCKSKKQVRRMVCDCTLTKEELDYGVMGCKEECLNRLLMIECGSRCPNGEACSNKKFQKKEFAKVEIFKTEKKGWGLRTLENIYVGQFLMEFVGEVLNHKEYRQRVKQYAKEKNVHSYFMALKTDEILDATCKGNFSRFINHSCNPNCETQKWTVNGELRVGVFSKQPLSIGEELTLDYQFQRYGREAQKCFCGADNCSGFIGGAKQISIDAYSSNRNILSRKRKGSEDKKRDLEDMILEEEIEKFNENRGLRNREDTLKLARLMVRADDSVTRHQLLDIILKTEEQACLRLFLDYHGLPLLWSWMTDVVELDLKTKILQVLSLLPISNKTMLLDSKVMSIVEKWLSECSPNSTENISIKTETLEKSVPVTATSEGVTDSSVKKLKVSDLSDSETDSASSHTVVDNSYEVNSVIPENFSKSETSVYGIAQPEISKEILSDSKEFSELKEDPGSNYKNNISNLASGLLSGWKNLKEVFRIPRLEQQKRKEDELEVDNNAKEKGQQEKSSDDDVQCGDQIQVVISGKNIFPDNHRAFDYEQAEMKLEDSSRRFVPTRTPVLAKPRQFNKQIRPPTFVKQVDKEVPRHKLNEDISKCNQDMLPPNLPPSPHIMRPALLPHPAFPEQPPINYPPPVNIPVHHPMEKSSPLLYPPQMMYTQSQDHYFCHLRKKFHDQKECLHMKHEDEVPFMGSPAPPLLPHNPGTIPPPSSMTSQPPLIQQPPTSATMPPCQPIGAPPTNVNAPPNNFLLPPTNVMPGGPPYIPNQSAPVQNFPPGTNVFNQNQPMYFIPPQSGLPNNPPTPFTESVPVQQTSATFPVQPVAPVVKEEPKPIKLPKNWRTATDSEGNVYYYHSITRQTQWDPPSEGDSDDDEESDSEESESSDTPTYDEPKIIHKHSKKKAKKRKPTKAAADTSVAPVRPEVAKKIKELFRTKMSSYIVHCLNAYRKPDCTVGRITSNEDFKYLARKLTHYTMTKELKQCKNVEDLDCNETVMHKAKDFIKKYMAKYGSQYSRKEKCSPD